MSVGKLLDDEVAKIVPTNSRPDRELDHERIEQGDDQKRRIPGCDAKKGRTIAHT